MTVIFQDGFTVGSDTNLSAHTPDTTGTSWASFINTGSLTPFVQASDDEVYPGGNSGSNTLAFKQNPAPTQADGTVTVVNAGSGSGNDDPQGVFARAVDTNNWLSFGVALNTANPDTFLTENVSGTTSYLASIETGATGTLELDVTGSTAIASINGTARTTQTVTGTLAGDAGIFWGAMTNTSTHDVRSTNSLDDYVYDEAAGGASNQTLTPNAVNEGLVIAAPTLSAGGVTLTPDSIAELAVIPSPTLTPGSVTLTPNAINEGLVVPDPTLTNTNTLAPDPITESLVVPDPTITGGATTLTPDPITASLVIPNPTITGGIPLGSNQGRMGVTGSVHRPRVP